jgi:hypothetical protein
LLKTLPGQRNELIEKGRVRAQEYSWKLTADQYKQVLQQAGMPLHERETITRTAPSYLLIPKHDMLQGNNSTRMTNQSLQDLHTLYDNYERIRLQSDTPALKRIPLLGFVLRTLVRIRNFQRIERARAELYRALWERQNQLEARLGLQDEESEIP